MAVFAYLLVFPAFVVLRIRRPELERPFRVGGGRTVAWAVSILATGWSVLAGICLLWPTTLPDGFTGRRLEFELLVLAPVLAVAALGCVFYRLGTAAS